VPIKHVYLHRRGSYLVFREWTDCCTFTVCRQMTSIVLQHFMKRCSVKLQPWTICFLSILNNVLGCYAGFLDNTQPRWWTARSARHTRASFWQNVCYTPATVICYSFSAREFRCATSIGLHHWMFKVLVYFFSQRHCLNVGHYTNSRTAMIAYHSTTQCM